MAKHHVVIVGGGFGGTKSALSLAASNDFKVTLLSDQTDFRYYPSLYRTATGGRTYISSVPLAEIFKGKPVNIIIDSVAHLDRTKKTVTTKKGQTIDYDSLVLALGVQTNYFGIKGLEKYSYSIKSVEEAERFKRHLHQQLIDEKHLDLNYVIIGGGPTGIELAGVLPAYLKAIAKKHQIKHPVIKVDLVELAPRLLPRMPKDMGRAVAYHLKKSKVRLYLDTLVLAESAENLSLKNKNLKSETVVWTAGVANHPFFADNGFQINKNNKVRVDQFLQAEPNIFVIGDNADTPYSGMAQTAIHDGRYVADYIRQIVNGKEAAPYSAKKPIYVFPAGHKWAAVLWGKLRIYGRPGYYLRRLADLVAYHDYEPWQLATKRWIAENDAEDNCPICGYI